MLNWLFLVFILFVTVGLLVFMVLTIGRKLQADPSNLTSNLGTATILSPEPQADRWRVRWRGQSWAAVNIDPAVSLELGDEVLVVAHEGTCLQVISRRSLLPRN